MIMWSLASALSCFFLIRFLALSPWCITSFTGAWLGSVVYTLSQMHDQFHRCITCFTGATLISQGQNPFHSCSAQPVSHMHVAFRTCTAGFTFALSVSHIHEPCHRCTTCFTAAWLISHVHDPFNIRTTHF